MRSCGEMALDVAEFGLAVGRAPQADEADALEARGQDVLREALQKFDRWDGGVLGLVWFGVGSPGVGDRLGFEVVGEDALGGDRDAAHIGAKVFEHLHRSAKWRLDAHDPWAGDAGVESCREGIETGQFGEGRGAVDGERVLAIGLQQQGAHPSLESRS